MACTGVDRKLSPALLVKNIISTIAVAVFSTGMLYVEVWCSLTGVLVVGCGIIL